MPETEPLIEKSIAELGLSVNENSGYPELSASLWRKQLKEGKLDAFIDPTEMQEYRRRARTIVSRAN